MNRTRWLALLPFTLLAACSHPDEEGVFGEASDGDASGTPAASSGATSGGGGQSDDAAGTAATTGASTGSGGSAVACDADGDGDLSVASCGGTDCDDSDPDVHAGQEGWFTAARADGSFDWNCDGHEEKQTATVSCEGTLGCGTRLGEEGFEADVECGGEGQMGSCQGIPCSFSASGAAKQGCR